MKMKVDLKKKRALAVAVLLSLGCYGQAWADTVISNDKNIVAGATENIGGVNEDIVIKNERIKVESNATLNVSGKKINIIGSNDEFPHTELVFINQGTVNLNADEIYIDRVITIGGEQSAVLNINQNPAYKNGIVKFNSDICGSLLEGRSTANINFYGKESYLAGSVYYGEKVNLNFDAGSTWRVPVTYNDVNDLKISNGSVIEFIYDGTNAGISCNPFGYIHIKNLNIENGFIKMNFDGSKATNGNTGFENYKTNHLTCENFTGNASIILNNVGADSSNVIGTVLAEVRSGNGIFNVVKEEGTLSWTNYNLEGLVKEPDDGPWPIKPYQRTEWTITGVTKETAPTTSVNTLLSTVTAGYDTWRNDTDKLNERMGELRLNGAGNDGVWVRTKGSEFGRHGGNGSYTNKQQTYQLGYDAVTSKDDKQTTYTGVAAEYGKGSLSFDSGTGTMKSIGMGVYQTKMYESGHYLDLVGRFDKYKNDFHVADTQGNAISGKYGNNALSLSVEYGRKNELKHGWYVEPQSEVTLGYMFGNDFTTSNNIRVEQKNMPALIGRLGLNVGREVSDKVNFYVKASVNHDFLGNYDVQMTDMTSGERLGASDRFGSSWFDYGAGLSVKTGKDSYAYFDIERAVGGEYKKNWDWNAGVRWSF